MVEWRGLVGSEALLPIDLVFDYGLYLSRRAALAEGDWVAGSARLDLDELGAYKRLEPLLATAPRDATYWWPVANGYCAARLTSKGADNVELALLHVTPPDSLPPALAALVLLPWIGTAVAPDAWEDQHSLRIDTSSLRQATAASVEAIRRELSEDALIAVYSGVFADRLPAGHTDLAAPLSPIALGGLLLPLERDLASRFALAGWLPSLAASDSGSWSVAAGTTPPQVPVDPAVKVRAEQIASELLGTGSRTTASRPEQSRGPDAPSMRGVERDEVRIAVWGPSAAGKTAFLTQLYLTKPGIEDSDWKILPPHTPGIIDDIQKRRTLVKATNRFPPATAVGLGAEVAYRFDHYSTGRQATLTVKDIAGAQWENHDDQASGRLTEAEAIVLMFDPSLGAMKLFTQISTTLERLFGARGPNAGLDQRPVAVCLAKADTLIRTAADLRRAVEDPDAFVRKELEPTRIIETIDKFCATYRLFPVSAIGVEHLWGVIEPVLFYDEALDERLRSVADGFNLKAPFIWVFETLEIAQ